jgi:hypothetical protein
MATSPPWNWTTDVLPTDGQEVWVRLIVASNKPYLATWSEGAATFYYIKDGINLSAPWFVCPQWREQST